MISFELYHWMLATRYYRSSREMPYVLDGEEVPETLEKQINTINYVGIGLCIIASSMVFTEQKFEVLSKVLFVLFCIMMLGSAILMVVALLKMRRCFVDKGLVEQVSPLKMTIHALSFLIYVAEYCVIAICEVFFLGTMYRENFLVSWFVDTIFGGLSYTCLFFVLWHLGKKSEDRKESVSSNSTIAEEPGDVDEDQEIIERKARVASN